MAISAVGRYPTRVEPATPDYPFGGAKNALTPRDGTGTPWEKDLLNDIFGLQQALLSESGISPSGTSDTAVNSQYLQAIKSLSGSVYSTISSMNSATNVPVGASATVLEYGPGIESGVLFFRSIAAGTAGAPDNLGALFDSTGTPAIQWQQNFPSSMTPEMFGAVSDFVVLTASGTDNLASLTAMIAHAKSSGLSISGKGQYGVSDTIEIDFPIHMTGVGTGFEQLFSDTDTILSGFWFCLLDGSFASTNQILDITYNGSGSEQRVHAVFNNVGVYGSRSATANPTLGSSFDQNAGGIGFNLAGARYVHLNRCIAMRCAEDGIKAVSGGTGTVSPNNVTIFDCAGLGNGDDGLDWSGGDSTVIGGQFGYNGGDGIAAAGGLVFGAAPRCWDNFQYGTRITGDDCSGNVVDYDNQLSGFLLSGDRRRVFMSIQAQDNGKDTGQTSDVRSGVRVSGASTGCLLTINSENKHEDTTTGQVRGLTISSASADVTYVIDGDTSDGMNLVSDASALSSSKFDSIRVGANGDKIEEILKATVTFNPGPIANDGVDSIQVAVPGARAGDVASATFSSITVSGWLISAIVISNNLVDVTILNKTGAAIDLASGTITVIVTAPA